MGQSQRTLPRVPATRALPHKTALPQTRRRARVDVKTLCHSTTQNAHTNSRSGDAPHNELRLSRAAEGGVGSSRVLGGLCVSSLLADI
jgi:hypothetical protein